MHDSNSQARPNCKPRLNRAVALCAALSLVGCATAGAHVKGQQKWAQAAVKTIEYVNLTNQSLYKKGKTYFRSSVRKKALACRAARDMYCKTARGEFAKYRKFANTSIALDLAVITALKAVALADKPRADKIILELLAKVGFMKSEVQRLIKELSV